MDVKKIYFCSKRCVESFVHHNIFRNYGVITAQETTAVCQQSLPTFLQSLLSKLYMENRD